MVAARRAGVDCRRLQLLARTLPLGTGRGAAKGDPRLSSGDLSARVGDPVNRRRDEIGHLARDFDAMAERLEALLGSHAGY